MILGANHNAQGHKDPLDDEIAEVIVFDKALSDKDMALVNEYLKRQYSK